MDGAVVTIPTDVRDRDGRIRWVVLATFVGVDGAEPRCVDYRVRVVPATSSASEGVRAAHQLIRQLEANAISPADVAQLGTIPPEGIPRRVFEEASQAKLLASARAKVKRRPERHTARTRELLERQARKRVGRPPLRTLSERLRILAAVEAAYDTGRTLADVARDHDMSRSSLRDLLAWARHDADPSLFTGTTPGRRGGALTPTARALLDETGDQ